MDNLPPPSNVVPGNAASTDKKDADADSKEPKSKVDPAVRESIKDSILEGNPNVKWDDIKGLAEVKKILNETIVLPTLRPDIF